MADVETLIEAVKVGDAARVRAIVDASPSLAGGRLSNGETPVMTAVYRGHHHLVAVLLDAGAELDVFAAAATGRSDELRRALDDAKAVNSFANDGWTPLHLAAFFGQLDAARLLVERGADVHAVSRNSLANTPLHAATAGKHSEVALLLLANGANAHSVDAGGYTAVKIAEQNNLSEVVRSVNEP